MKMNLKPALRFQFTDLMKSSLAFLATIAAITVCIPLIQYLVGGRGAVSMGGYVVIAAIYLFVVGIVAPRGYLRMDIQMGVSRATSFTAQLITTVLVSLALSLVGELISTVVQLFTKNSSMFFVDLFQMMYNDGEPLSFGGHMLSICFNTCICVFAYISGMFYTLLFWRLNKFWTVVAALALVLLANLGLNADVFAPIMPWLGRMATAFFEAVTRGPAALMIFFLVCAAILAFIEWLLLRRAYIRASVG